MNENKARYIALIVIALEAIAAFFLCWPMIYVMFLPELSVQGRIPPLEMTIIFLFLLFFFGVGALIILSIFFKEFFTSLQDWKFCYQFLSLAS